MTGGNVGELGSHILPTRDGRFVILTSLYATTSASIGDHHRRNRHNGRSARRSNTDSTVAATSTTAATATPAATPTATDTAATASAAASPTDASPTTAAGILAQLNATLAKLKGNGNKSIELDSANAASGTDHTAQYCQFLAHRAISATRPT